MADTMETEALKLEDGVFTNTSKDCLCLPACNEINYEAEISQVEIMEPYYKNYFPEQNLSYIRENVAAVTVYFKDESFISNERGELYGLTDFLGNTGGLLGLFLGFSLLSLAEILYFLTLRLIFEDHRKSSEKAEEEEKRCEQQLALRKNSMKPNHVVAWT